MSFQSILFEIERGHDLVEVEIEAEMYAASYGSRDSMGLQMEPDEDADCEITAVTGPEGESYTLTEKEEEEAKEALLKAEAKACRYRFL